ncbi:hypothetical protein DNFV4_00867 [Nitrospira tepida]|uniref:Uncharacterized protein n=1 Tax=Nitrospira tepida TaxID=2973512 RepID=A0AA86T1W2_9BACT|nr:hypothetical protein [Nitrospira tepida]CAI4030439.1 hypothetical protein DNFV4_00867 [Nitrospira tepida]
MIKRPATPNRQPLEGAERLVWEFVGLVALLLTIAGVVIVLWR